MNTSTKKLVIFDFDGVIVDSEVIANEVDAKALTQAGHNTNTEECIRKYTGLSYESMSKSILLESGIQLTEKFWIETP